LTIKGEVIPRPERLNVLFHDTIGTVQMEQVEFGFERVQPRQHQETEIWIQNFGKEPLQLSVDNPLAFVKVTVPERLEPNYPEKLLVEIDASKVDSTLRGRQAGAFVWKTENATGQTVTQSIPVVANFIDDFGALTPDERKNSPVIQFSAKSLDFGLLKKKRMSRELVITNTGNTALKLHSFIVDDPDVVQVKGLKNNVIQPKGTLKLKIYADPGKVSGDFTTYLNVVCNDPRSPVDYVRIAFQK
jgi:hypothetical protein